MHSGYLGYLYVFLFDEQSETAATEQYSAKWKK